MVTRKAGRYKMLEIDMLAKEEATRRFGLHPSLHFPVAARDKKAIEKYIGEIKVELSKKGTDRAFLVSVPERHDREMHLPLWQLERSSVLCPELQVWVHVDFSGYRRAYKKALPAESIKGMVMGHVLNRNVARLKLFRYVRLLPITREVNSSSAFSEKWAIEYHSTTEMQKQHTESLKNIQYADLSDIVMMLNILPGGGVMGTVNDAQYLVDFPK